MVCLFDEVNSHGHNWRRYLKTTRIDGLAFISISSRVLCYHTIITIVTVLQFREIWMYNSGFK